MPAKLLIIGLDSAEATLIERWAADGHLPAFRRLQEKGATYRLDNCMETLPGAIWSELNTGISAGKRPDYSPTTQLHTGDAQPRPVSPDEMDPETYYWTMASRAGKRVAVVDSINCVPAADFNGIQVLQWGVHERHFPSVSNPPELLEELRAQYGAFPVENCDLHGSKTSGYRSLLEKLEVGVRRRTEMMLDLLDREDWDLFTCLYGEAHCVGHQFWHFLDSASSNYIADAPQDLKDAVRTVYAAIDEGLAALMAASGPNAQILVVASHGMEPYVGGFQLMPEALLRLGMRKTLPAEKNGSGLKTRMAGLFRGFQTWFGTLSAPVKAPFKQVARAIPAYGRMRDTIGHSDTPLGSPLTKAASFRANRCQAVRLNLIGREPNGCVQPGAEAEALIDELRRELGALIDPKSGQPIIKTILTATEAFGPDHHPDVPDLILGFRDGLGRFDECFSDRVGLIHVPYGPPHNPRSGDHSAESRLWMLGPGFEATDTPLEGNVLDIAPTVLSLLGVPLPAEFDGAPLRP